VGGTAVGGTAVGGTAVGGTAVGATVVAAGPQPARMTVRTRTITPNLAKLILIFIMISKISFISNFVLIW
jgi:hypothetical protein